VYLLLPSIRLTNETPRQAIKENRDIHLLHTHFRYGAKQQAPGCEGGQKNAPTKLIPKRTVSSNGNGSNILAVGVVEREHIASWLDMNLWLRLRKIPYSSKAYSGCGVDECGERMVG
jgi:hypothetical protein